VFVKLPQETKPIYVDFDSPVSVEIMAKMIRNTQKKQPDKEIVFSEMLPTPEQAWLCDSEDNRYCCELRMVVLDNM
jgi:hypothetical protein